MTATGTTAATGRTVWVKNPLAILAEGSGGGIVVRGSEIVELIRAGDVPATVIDEVFDARDHVVIPGLVNTHHHFFQTMTRAHPAALNKPLFPWLESLYPFWNSFTPEAFRIATRTAYAELLLSGCTTAADHHYLYPSGMEDSVDVQVEEARALGIRTTITRGSMSDRNGGVTPSELTQDEDAILSDSERVLERYHSTQPGAMVQIALAPCSPFNVTADLLQQSAALAERYDARLHIHCGETIDELDYCLERFGRRPLDYLDDLGWVGDRTWLAHGIHFNDDEIRRLGRAGVGIAHCPTSNMVLASGFCRTPELEAAGSPIGLGVDGSASNDSSNMMEAVRHAFMLNRLRYGAESITHLDALRWGTAGSAACLGRDDIGTIRVGAQADLAMFRLDELRFAGAQDPLAALVLCGAHRADRVMVAGQWRVIDSEIVGLDTNALRERHQRLALDMFAEA